MSDIHDSSDTPPLNDSPENLDTAESAATVDDGSISYVSLIADPFGLKNLEIAEAQETDEEMDDALPEEELISEDDGLDAGALSPGGYLGGTEDELVIDEPLRLNDDAGELGRLAEAMDNARAESERCATDFVINPENALADWTPDSAVSAAEKVASQIAEDQALQAELAQEAADEKSAEHDPELLAALPQAPAPGEQMDLDEVQSCIEAILFMSDKPLSLEKIHEMIGQDFPHSVFQEAMTALADRYRSNAHGVEVAQVANGYQLRTKPGRAALVKKLAKVQTQRLSSGAMETLAIVAYRQPVMKEDIDKIRGVDSSYFVRHLLDRKLIQICGRSELPGRPMLYSTTDEFLSLFGLKDLSAMPSLREIEQMVPASQSGNPDDEDPRVKEMRRLVGQMKADHSTQLTYDPREDEKILKEIRERVQAISSSTPYLEQQKALEKQAAELAAQGLTPEQAAAIEAGASVQPELPASSTAPIETAPIEVAPADLAPLISE